MDVQELIKTIDNLQSNASAGLIVIFYYLVVYWSRIKDGLGLTTKQRKADLDKIEQNYHLLKLRIELEKIKQDSGLDKDILEILEQEMQTRMEIKKSEPFTGLQKFVAIPIMIVFIIFGFLDFQALTEDSDSTSLDILLGELFCFTITIIGFWGIPHLQKQKSSWFKKTGFIVFWSFAFYIIGCILIYIYSNTILNDTQFADDSVGIIFLISVICSIILGIFKKLPLMKQSTPDE